MPDKFDPYREALVVEQNTVWPGTFDTWESSKKQALETALHADAESASVLDYIRIHTGFCRQITVTEEDVERIQTTEK